MNHLVDKLYLQLYMGCFYYSPYQNVITYCNIKVIDMTNKWAMTT